MRLITLVENTCIHSDFGFEHGLSIYLEVGEQRLLFDFGGSTLFADNAKKLNISIEDVDFAVLSHGHYDHGGGLATFLRHNSVAPIYVQAKAFEPHRSIRSHGRTEDIELDPALSEHPQIIPVSGQYTIAPGIWLFSDIQGRRLFPSTNQGLLQAVGEEWEPDAFVHEQVLVVEFENKSLLLTGCAHTGVINILDQYKAITGCYPNYVVGGFHLASRTFGDESEQNIREIGRYLLNTGAMYYTGHCTGDNPFALLKTILGDALERLSGGLILELT